MKTINIKGKNYTPVSERVLGAHEKEKYLSIETEIISHDPVLCKATVRTSKGVFIGHSAANPSKSIEKESPYEIAETSAVGRALGFAGYGIQESIASADEMRKVPKKQTEPFPDGARIKPGTNQLEGVNNNEI